MVLGGPVPLGVAEADGALVDRVGELDRSVSGGGNSTSRSGYSSSGILGQDVDTFRCTHPRKSVPCRPCRILAGAQCDPHDRDVLPICRSGGRGRRPADEQAHPPGGALSPVLRGDGERRGPEAGCRNGLHGPALGLYEAGGVFLRRGSASARFLPEGQVESAGDTARRPSQGDGGVAGSAVIVGHGHGHGPVGAHPAAPPATGVSRRHRVGNRIWALEDGDSQPGQVGTGGVDAQCQPQAGSPIGLPQAGMVDEPAIQPAAGASPPGRAGSGALVGPGAEEVGHEDRQLLSTLMGQDGPVGGDLTAAVRGRSVQSGQDRIIGGGLGSAQLRRRPRPLAGAGVQPLTVRGQLLSGIDEHVRVRAGGVRHRGGGADGLADSGPRHQGAVVRGPNLGGALVPGRGPLSGLGRQRPAQGAAPFAPRLVQGGGGCPGAQQQDGGGRAPRQPLGEPQLEGLSR